MIKSEFQQLYTWDFQQKDNIINIAIRLPPGFNPDLIKISSKNDSIMVELNDNPPIIAGKLFNTIESFVYKVFRNSLIIALVTNSTLLWNSIIIAEHPENGMIDPLSSFLIFSTNFKSNDLSVSTGSFVFLEKSVSYGYCPALLLGYDIYSKIPDASDRASRFLEIAANLYKNPDALFQMGINLLHKDRVEESLQCFSESSNLGNIKALSFIGFIHSPLSDILYQQKDPKKSIEAFESVISKTKDPTTLHEYAKLLYHGIGITRNREKALEYQALAKQLFRDTPDIIESNDQVIVSMQKRIKDLEDTVSQLQQKIEELTILVKCR